MLRLSKFLRVKVVHGAYRKKYVNKTQYGLQELFNLITKIVLKICTTMYSTSNTYLQTTTCISQITHTSKPLENVILLKKHFNVINP